METRAGDRSGNLEAALDPGRLRFVLVAPQSGGNVGAAARALKNLGFSRLELVSPECDPLGEPARRMAVDAIDVLRQARVHADLDAALEGAATVVGTSRRAGRWRHPNFRLDELAATLARLAAAGELAFVFGREADGLTQAELDRCTHLVHLLASRDYPSFNLAQAVLLVAYEMRLCLLAPSHGEPEEVLAGHAGREAMYAHLEAALRAMGFLEEHTAEGMMRRIRRILGRAELTPGDVKIFRGIARQALWLAGQAIGEPVESGSPEREGDRGA